LVSQYNNSPKDARDNTYQYWKQQRAVGHPNFENVIDIKCSKQDKIQVTYEYEGLKDKSNTTNEIVPIYNFILRDYIPEDTHLSSIDGISENTFPFIISYTENKKIMAKSIYNNFFYVKYLIRNLVINNLVDKTRADKIKVHYNFMSKYVHPSIDSIDIWLQFNESRIANYPKINSNIYRELILLYIGRLMYLYLNTYVKYYKNNENQKECKKYENFIEELNLMSNDLWFFDNEPMQYDIDKSNMQKQILKQINKSIFNGIHYPKNPLERLNLMRNNM
jgi:hypothetical protein